MSAFNSKFKSGIHSSTIGMKMSAVPAAASTQPAKVAAVPAAASTQPAKVVAVPAAASTLNTKVAAVQAAASTLATKIVAVPAADSTLSYTPGQFRKIVKCTQYVMITKINLSTEKISDTTIEERYNKYGKIIGIAVDKIRAVVEFETPEAAKRAVQGEQHDLLGGINVGVFFAQKFDQLVEAKAAKTIKPLSQRNKTADEDAGCVPDRTRDGRNYDQESDRSYRGSRRSPDSDRRRSPDRDRRRSPDRDRRRSPDRDRRRSPDRDRRRSPDRDRRRSPDRDRRRSPDRDRRRSPDHDRRRSPDHDRRRSPDHDRRRSPDRERHSRDNGRDYRRTPNRDHGSRDGPAGEDRDRSPIRPNRNAESKPEVQEKEKTAEELLMELSESLSGTLENKTFHAYNWSDPRQSYDVIKAKTTPDEIYDCLLIVCQGELPPCRLYSKVIDQRLTIMGLNVTVVFPDDVQLVTRIMDDVRAQCRLYAIVVTPQNQVHKSLTVNILPFIGKRQEHRNMPLEDAMLLIKRTFESYTMDRPMDELSDVINIAQLPGPPNNRAIVQPTKWTNPKEPPPVANVQPPSAINAIPGKVENTTKGPTSELLQVSAFAKANIMVPGQANKSGSIPGNAFTKPICSASSTPHNVLPSIRKPTSTTAQPIKELPIFPISSKSIQSVPPGKEGPPTSGNPKHIPSMQRREGAAKINSTARPNEDESANRNSGPVRRPQAADYFNASVATPSHTYASNVANPSVPPPQPVRPPQSAPQPQPISVPQPVPPVVTRESVAPPSNNPNFSTGSVVPITTTFIGQSNPVMDTGVATARLSERSSTSGDGEGDQLLNRGSDGRPEVMLLLRQLGENKPCTLRELDRVIGHLQNYRHRMLNPEKDRTAIKSAVREYMDQLPPKRENELLGVHGVLKHEALDNVWNSKSTVTRPLATPKALPKIAPAGRMQPVQTTPPPPNPRAMLAAWTAVNAEFVRPSRLSAEAAITGQDNGNDFVKPARSTMEDEEMRPISRSNDLARPSSHSNEDFVRPSSCSNDTIPRPNSRINDEYGFGRSSSREANYSTQSVPDMGDLRAAIQNNSEVAVKSGGGPPRDLDYHQGTLGSSQAATVSAPAAPLLNLDLPNIQKALESLIQSGSLLQSIGVAVSASNAAAVTPGHPLIPGQVASVRSGNEDRRHQLLQEQQQFQEELNSETTLQHRHNTRGDWPERVSALQRLGDRTSLPDSDLSAHSSRPFETERRVLLEGDRRNPLESDRRVMDRRIPGDINRLGSSDMNLSGPSNMGGRGPPHMDRRGPSDMGGRGPHDMDRRGPLDMNQRGLPDMKHKDPVDINFRGPPEMDRRGSLEISHRGLPDMDRRGPPDMERMGAPDMERRGPPDMERRGPPDMDRRSQIEMNSTIDRNQLDVDQKGQPDINWRSPSNMERRGLLDMNRRVLLDMDRRGPLNMDRRGPPDMDRRGLPNMDRRGPLDMEGRGHLDMDRRGPLDMNRRGPPDMDRRGPLDMEGRGHLDMDRRGPLDMERRGPLDMERRGPLDMERRGPLDMNRRGPPDMDRRGPLDMDGKGMHPMKYPRLESLARGETPQAPAWGRFATE